MRENADQNNSEYGHFLHTETYVKLTRNWHRTHLIDNIVDCYENQLDSKQLLRIYWY